MNLGWCTSYFHLTSTLTIHLFSNLGGAPQKKEDNAPSPLLKLLQTLT